MSNEQNVINVTLHGRQYAVKCPAGKETALQNAARYLDQVMQDIASEQHLVEPNKISVISALNITYELLQSQAIDTKDIDRASRRIKKLYDKIENALTHQEELEV